MKYTIIAISVGIALAGASIVHADHPSTETVHQAVMSAVIQASVSMDCVIERNLAFGSRGVAVECLQQELKSGGHLNIGAPTGYFGPLTKAAVIKWQEQNGVPATGYFGPLSRAVFASAHSTVTPMMHSHEPVDASSWPTQPKVSIALHKDTMSGYNLEIKTENFRFAPEHVNGAVIPSEGHAHVMVNGKKFARVYGSWMHLPQELFLAGSNEVLVTLNTNDHSDIVVAGIRVEAKEVVTN